MLSFSKQLKVSFIIILLLFFFFQLNVSVPATGNPYRVRITGGNDKQGFPEQQGVLVNRMYIFKKINFTIKNNEFKKNNNCKHYSKVHL